MDITTEPYLNYTDEIVIEAALEGNNALLSKALHAVTQPKVMQLTKTVSSERCLQEGSLSISNYDNFTLTQAVRTRMIVSDPIKNLLEGNHLNLLNEGLRNRLIVPTKAELKSFLKRKQSALALQCLKSVRSSRHSTHPLLKGQSIIYEVIELMRYPATMTESFRIFKYIKNSSLTQGHFVKLRYILTDLATSKYSADYKLAKTSNAILNCVLAKELIDHIKYCFDQFTLPFEKLSVQFSDLANTTLSETEISCQVKAIILDKTYGEETLLDLLVDKSEKYRTLLKDPRVKQIVKEMWTSGIRLELGFSGCSYVVANYNIHGSIASNTQHLSLSQTHSSLFQLRSWIYDCSIRHIFQTMSLILMTATLCSILVNYITAQRLLNIKYDLSQSEIDFAHSRLKDSGEQINNYFFPAIVILSVHSFFTLIYIMLTRPSFKLDPRHVFDGILIVCATIANSNAFGEPSEGFSDSPYEYLWVLMVFSFLFRVILGLVLSEKFGSMIRILVAVFVSILRFLFIYFLILFVFALSANVLFYTSPGYENVRKSLITMLSASLGAFDFYAFEDRKELGEVFLMVWIVLSAVLIMNILVAILSAKYEELSPNADADFVVMVMQNYDGIGYTQKYGGLIIAPVPLNILTTPLTVLYFFSIDTVKLSAILAKVSYVPVFLVAMFLFVVYNALMSVGCYIEMIFWILQDDNSRISKRLKDASYWVVVGPPYLGYLSLISIPVFAKFLWTIEPFKQQKTFKAEHSELVLAKLQSFTEENPDKQFIEWDEIEGLLKSKVNSATTLVITMNDKSGNISKRAKKKTVEDILEYYERLYSLMFVMMKFVDPLTKQIDLAYAIETLQTKSIEFLETFSIHYFIKAQRRLTAEEDDDVVIRLR